MQNIVNVQYTHRPVIILHLTAEVVDHVVNVLGVAVLLLEELGHIVNLVPVQRLGPLAGEAHGNDVGEDVGQVQVIAIHLGIQRSYHRGQKSYQSLMHLPEIFSYSH